MRAIIECPGCGKEKPHHAKGLCNQCYHRQYKRQWRIDHRDQYLSTHKRYGKQWRENNPDKAREQDHRRYLSLKTRRLVILREQIGTVCAQCGEGRVAALEYHHKDGSGAGGNLLAMSWAQFNKELPVLQALCGTCHNIQHRSR